MDFAPLLLMQRLRQHHGIEHATMQLLSQRLPGTLLVAHSDCHGFVVFGEMDRVTLQAAAEEALKRLQHGERQLAVHPNCGTNLTAAGFLSGTAAWLLSRGRSRPWWDRLAGAILGATLALLVAPTVGRWAQENITTSPEVAGLRVGAVLRTEGGHTARHRVIIEHG